MIRKYKTHWGVIMPRGGGVKRFKTEKEAKQFMLACGLFEDVLPSDETPDESPVTSYDEYGVIGIEHEQEAHDASGEDEEAE